MKEQWFRAIDDLLKHPDLFTYSEGLGIYYAYVREPYYSPATAQRAWDLLQTFVQPKAEKPEFPAYVGSDGAEHGEY